MRRDRIRAVAVVIPAHDEEDLLGAALAALSTAVRRAAARATVTVHVVLDACTDASAEIAARHPDPAFEIVEISARSVGAARAAGALSGRMRHAGVAPSALWTAHTDADSVVPPHWLEHQLDLADAGADLVLGTVRPDARDLTPEQLAAWKLTHAPESIRGRVYGANLGIRASTLALAGGFEPDPLHEDVRLVARAVAAGARVEASDAARVQTSGRMHGRTAGGFAGYLREQLLPLAQAAQAAQSSVPPERMTA